MINIFSFCNKNTFTQDPVVRKNNLHQLLLQAQGWEFFYYSITFAFQYLHKLEWNLFKKKKLSTVIYINHMKIELTFLFLPSSCNNMFVFRRFLARATSLSVTLVQSRILKTNWKNQNVK